MPSSTSSMIPHPTSNASLQKTGSCSQEIADLQVGTAKGTEGKESESPDGSCKKWVNMDRVVTTALRKERTWAANAERL